MNRQEARRLAMRFAANACTPEEHKAFLAWLSDLPPSESAAMIDEFSGIFKNIRDIPENGDLWNRVQRRLDEVSTGFPASPSTPATSAVSSMPAVSSTPSTAVRVMDPLSTGFWFRRIGMVAAAVAAFFLLIPRVFFSSNKKPAPAIVRRTADDASPGGDRATLRLANGSVIFLDSLHDGQLAREGAAEVVKPGNGRLVYTLPGSKAVPDSQTLSFNTITTPKGGQYQVTLSDGSKVWLNSASTLRYPTVFPGKERKVELSGEGYFEIAANAHMPFSVQVGPMQVKVLGTQFDVMAYKDEQTVRTTVLQGAVKVERGNLSTKLAPGEQALLDSAGRRMDRVVTDVQKVIAWKNGVFDFENEDLPGIMRQLSRWYDIEVLYKVEPGNPELSGGISKRLNLSQVLRLLEKNGINHFTIEGKKVTVLP